MACSWVHRSRSPAITLHEYRLALSTLTPPQWLAFGAWSEASETIDGNLEAFARAENREAYERVAIFYLRAAGVDGLLTEAEKEVATAADAAYAAKLAAIAAERAALSAWWSITAAVLALLLTLVLQARC